MIDIRPNQPVFIVGVGRSGTSLLHGILASHPDMFFPPETGLLRRLILTQRIPRHIDRNSLDSVWNLLSGDSRFSRLEITTLIQLQSILNIGDEGITNAEFYMRILGSLAAGKKIIGDKDPRLVEFLPLIHVAWPEAYVIHVIRDPRDVVASKKAAKWSRGKPLWYHLLANSVQYHAGCKDGGKLFGERYIEVFYEELLQDEDAVVSRLCDSLGISFVPTMLSYSNESRRLVANEEMAWKKETLGPILKNNSGKWQSKLSGMEIAVTESVCATAISQNAFCLPPSNTYSKFSPMKIIASIYGSLITLVSWAYTRLRWLRLLRYGIPI